MQCGARLRMLTCPPLSLIIVLQALISRLTVGFRLWRQVCWKTTHQTQHGGAALTQKLKTLLRSLSSMDRHSLCSGCNRRSHLVFHINTNSFFHGTATEIWHPGTVHSAFLSSCSCVWLISLLIVLNFKIKINHWDFFIISVLLCLSSRVPRAFRATRIQGSFGPKMTFWLPLALTW